MCNSKAHWKRPHMEAKDETKGEILHTNEVIEKHGDISISFYSPPPSPPTSTQQRE